MLVVTLAIFLPNYIFYATNLRMYSLIFMASMVFIDAVSRVLTSEAKVSRGMLAWLVISGLALVGSDYAAVLYYMAGLLMIGLYSFARSTAKPLLAVIVPGIGFGMVGAMTFSDIVAIKSWGIESYQGPAWAGIVNCANGAISSLSSSARPDLPGSSAPAFSPGSSAHFNGAIVPGQWTPVDA
jgi:hypothetical protein